MPPKPPGPSSRDQLAALRASVAELEQEVARRQREAAAMAEAARLAGGGPRPSRTLAERVVGSIVQLFGASSAIIRRLEPDGTLVALAWAGALGPPAFERGRACPAGVGHGGESGGARPGRVEPDVLTDPEVTLTPDLRELDETTPDRAVLAVPLRARGDVIGVLSSIYPVGRVLREDEVRLAEAFADQVALALENARLLAETRGRLAESETLLAVAGVLSQPVPERGGHAARGPRSGASVRRRHGRHLLPSMPPARRSGRSRGTTCRSISFPRSSRPRFPWSCSMRP